MLEKVGCEPIAMEVLSSMALVKTRLALARNKPCVKTIVDAVQCHNVFLDLLARQEPFDQYLLSRHIQRLLPDEWPLWLRYTKNLHHRHCRDRR